MSRPNREHSEHWSKRFQYREAGPQLLLQALLQPIVNGGGRIEREYRLEHRRTDLLIQWPLDPNQGFLGAVQRIVIELKLLHRSLKSTQREGLAQTADEMEPMDATEKHLLIFDRRPDIPWEQRIFEQDDRHGAHKIRVCEL